MKKIIFAAWISLTLVILFFYPLITTLQEQIVELHWRIQNTYELLAAIALLTIIFTGIIFCTEQHANRYFKIAVYFFLSFIPLYSFSLHFVRQLVPAEALLNIAQFISIHRVLFLATGAFVIALLMVSAKKNPNRYLNIIVVLLLILSPVNVTSAWTIWKIRGNDVPIFIEKDENQPQVAKQRPVPPSYNMIVLLFDELSYEYLYKNRAIDSKYPNLKYFSSISTNYHSATAPGKSTHVSIPGLLTTKRYTYENENTVIEYIADNKNTNGRKKELLKIDRANIFSIAKRKDLTLFSEAKRNGLKTAAFGPYLPYCEIYSSVLDRCRSFSFHNYGTIEKNFSLLNPIRNTLLIWPHQEPFAKKLAASRMQKETADETIRLSIEVLDSPQPYLLFTHFMITHAPYTFNKDGFYKNKNPYLENDENYRAALGYVDTILGQLIDRLKKNGKFENSTIIVLSDHNYRIRFPDHKDAIPLLIKKIGQNKRQDIFKPVKAEILLKDELNNVLYAKLR